jgi:mono/diheme cytochrome c family protein
MRTFIGHALLLGASVSFGATPEKSLQTVSFNKQIRPILSENCFTCHGPDKAARKGGLRLDDRNATLAGGEGAPAIVPGNSAAVKS